MRHRRRTRPDDLGTLDRGQQLLGFRWIHQTRPPQHLERAEEVARLAEAARRAHGAGLQVNAGHGITLANLPELFAIPHLAELNIGHSIVSRAVFTGLTAAVAEMRAAMNAYRG